MDRSVLSALMSVLLGISSASTFGLVWSSSRAPEPPCPEGDWHILEPVSYENISIFPVASATGYDISYFLTLDEGLSSGEVVVREQGSDGMARSRDGEPRLIPDYRTGPAVNQLVLVNRSKRPLLLLAGELVSGGKQDRIIGKDRIVPVGAPPLPLDVFCVEHGRWSSGANFVASKTIVHPSVREKAAVDQAQNEVWNAVRSGSTAAPPPNAPAARLSAEVLSEAIATAAPTESYAKVYDSRASGVSIDDFVQHLAARFANQTAHLKGERIIGVIVAYGGEVAWSDIFASSDLFNHYWNKLLRSYAVEALARPTLREVASRDDASSFLRRLNGRERQETDPNVYIWREITEGRLTQIELDALDPKQFTLHRLLLRRT
jgi:ARG and Rhodanese-Phosphatase-superfamily-associated Protein domain